MSSQLGITGIVPPQPVQLSRDRRVEEDRSRGRESRPGTRDISVFCVGWQDWGWRWLVAGSKVSSQAAAASWLPREPWPVSAGVTEWRHHWTPRNRLSVRQSHPQPCLCPSEEPSASARRQERMTRWDSQAWLWQGLLALKSCSAFTCLILTLKITTLALSIVTQMLAEYYLFISKIRAEILYGLFLTEIIVK